MKIKRKLREKKFIRAYIENGGNATKAYLAINPEYKGENERILGHQYLTKLNISDEEIMEELGLTDNYIYEKLKEGTEATKVTRLGMEVEDYAVRHQYLETTLKLRNKYPIEKHKIDIEGELKITDARQKILSRIDSIASRRRKKRNNQQPE